MESTIAFIPIRIGSKSIPLKNIKNIGGLPLFIHSVVAAIACRYIDKVYIYTDTSIIESLVSEYLIPLPQELLNKIVIEQRPAETATDSASTESAMLAFSEKHYFKNIILMQATSPLVSSNDLNNGIELFQSGIYDSVLSAVKNLRFLWKKNDVGEAFPLNYDYSIRPRRQDFKGHYVENGAFYITSRELLLKSKNRISGKIGICEMPSYTYLEIDELDDWYQMAGIFAHKCEIISSHTMPKMLVMDCDGVLTDGGLGYTDSGIHFKLFNVIDGYGIHRLNDIGVKSIVITGEKDNVIIDRATKLSIECVITESDNKLCRLIEVCNKYNITLNDVAYIGDDLNDFQVIQNVGLSFAPCNAHNLIKKVANIQLKSSGGKLAVREMIEYILHRQMNIYCTD